MTGLIGAAMVLGSSGVAIDTGVATKAQLTKPDIFGDQIVFTAEGDIWLGDLKSSSAIRLTRDEGIEINPRFSPDGKTIAFSAQYEGGTYDAYTMPVAGGEPNRLTWDRVGAQVLDWTPDGQVMFRSRRDTANGNSFGLYVVPSTGGIAKRLPVPRGEFATFLPDGRLAYVPVSREWMNWFRYEGGAADAIWLADLKGGFKPLTKNPGVDTTPVWGGDAIYYVSEKTGVPNLWRLDPRTNQSSIVTRNVENEIRYPGSDGKRVIFQAGPTLAVYDPATKVSQPLTIHLIGERIHARPRLMPVSETTTDLAVGPTGKRLAAISRGQLLSIPAENGENRSLDSTLGARCSYPTWTPDGKTIAYVSDRTGENEIWSVPAEGGTPKQLTKGLQGNLISLLWSPDGKRLAAQDRDGRTLLVDGSTGAITVVSHSLMVGSYDTFQPTAEFSSNSKFLVFQEPAEAFLTRVAIYDIEKSSLRPLTPSGMSAISPTFSPDGKYVAFLAERKLQATVGNLTRRMAAFGTFRLTILGLDPTASSPFAPKLDEEGQKAPAADATAKPVTQTLDGIENRSFDAPIPDGEFSQAIWLDGQILLVRSDSVAPIDGAASKKLISFDIESKKAKDVADGVSVVRVSGDRSKILVAQDDTWSLIGATDGATKPIPLSGNIRLVPEGEWKQILRESWRIARDFFYDPGMHGVDWNAVWKKYEARLGEVGDRSDLARIQKDMLSELNTGHCYIGDPSRRKPPFSMGYLGADFESTADGARITRILRPDAFSPGMGSPLASPEVSAAVGDVITAIDGETVTRDRDIQSYLEGKGGKLSRISLKRGGASRSVVVKLLSSETALRYQDWVIGRAEYVRKAAGPGFGYMHIPDMVGQGATAFLKSHLANTEKDAVVVDFRANTGGFISSLLLENFAAKRYAYWRARQGGIWNREDWAFRGHLAAICNEENFSDGELVIEGWKNLKIGPVVGKRTGGGEVGSGGGYTLVDGGTIFVPNYAAFVDGKWLIEGFGATPTIEVEQDPAAVMAGKDPQLDRAVAELQAWLKREPIREGTAPKFPVKLKGSRGG